MTDLRSRYSNSLSLNDENEKCWKMNGSSNATNNSTLSLRISAYENSNEASSDSLNKSFQKSLIIQKQKQINPASKFVSHSPFEFQRQQNEKVPEPEVSHFKASQRLLNSNKSDLRSNTAFVDILSNSPGTLISSKKWEERKEALERFLALATENIKFNQEANYGEFVDILLKILSKDANINVCSVAAKCITQLAKGLRTKFGPYAATFVPVIFEKFKEKKALLRDPLIEAIDAIYPTTSIDAICDPIAAALGKPNPNIKIQTNQFLYRVFKTFNAQTAPMTVVKTLTPLIAKCTGESNAEAREASFAALGAIMKAIGKSNAMKMLGDVANDKAKMERIEKFYNQAVEEAQEEEAAKKAAAEQAAGSSHPAESSLSEATTQSTASSIAAPAAAVVESDPWDFADPVDILPDLPEKFEETVASKKWQERKEVLEVLLQLATDNIRLDPRANYGEIVATLTKILSKDANINVCAVAAKCITQLAKGLRSKFANHVPSVIEVIFEKFKEKKVLLRDPLVEAIDAVYAATTIEAVSENVAAALGKPNPNIKIQTNLFLYRVFKAFNVQTAPKKVIKTLTPLIAKCTGESDAEAREAAFSALGAIMKAIGKNNAMTMLGDIKHKRTKMAQIKKFYNQAVEEAPKTQQAAGSSQPVDPWDFVDPVDILPKLPEKFEETVASKKWQERKEVLEVLLQLATDNIRLDPNANYGEIVATLTKILSKDANIHVCAVSAKCITQLAKGLRTKFGPYAATFVPVIFEKFKEKKALLRDPLIEAIDAIYPTTSIDAICDPIAAALGKPNPNIKIQTNQFLYRVFKTFNAQTAPMTVVKTLTPLIAKCTGESDAEACEASFAALGAIMKAIGKSNAMKMLGDVATDKTKMAQIEKFYNQALEEAQKEAKKKCLIKFLNSQVKF